MNVDLLCNDGRYSTEAAQNGIVFDSLEEVILGVPEIALNFDS